MRRIVAQRRRMWIFRIAQVRLLRRAEHVGHASADLDDRARAPEVDRADVAALDLSVAAEHRHQASMVGAVHGAPAHAESQPSRRGLLRGSRLRSSGGVMTVIARFRLLPERIRHETSDGARAARRVQDSLRERQAALVDRVAPTKSAVRRLEEPVSRASRRLSGGRQSGVKRKRTFARPRRRSSLDLARRHGDGRDALAGPPRAAAPVR